MYYYHSRQDSCQGRRTLTVFRCRLPGGATDHFNLNGMRAFQDVRRRSNGKFRTRREQEKNYELELTPSRSTSSRSDSSSAAPQRSNNLPRTQLLLWKGYFFFCSPPKSDRSHFHDNIII